MNNCLILVTLTWFQHFKEGFVTEHQTVTKREENLELPMYLSNSRLTCKNTCR